MNIFKIITFILFTGLGISLQGQQRLENPIIVGGLSTPTLSAVNATLSNVLVPTGGAFTVTTGGEFTLWSATSNIFGSTLSLSISSIVVPYNSFINFTTGGEILGFTTGTVTPSSQQWPLTYATYTPPGSGTISGVVASNSGVLNMTLTNPYSAPGVTYTISATMPAKSELDFYDFTQIPINTVWAGGGLYNSYQPGDLVRVLFLGGNKSNVYSIAMLTELSIGQTVEAWDTNLDVLTYGNLGAYAAPFGSLIITATNSTAAASILGFSPAITLSLSGAVGGSVTLTLSDLQSTGATISTTLGASGVTAGSYTQANITVGTDGRITLASNGSGGITSLTLTGSNGITVNTGSVTTSGQTVTFGLPITLAGAGTLTMTTSTTITGGGTISLGGYTMTVPSTDTVDMIGTAQTISATKTFSGGMDSTGASTLASLVATSISNSGTFSNSGASTIGTLTFTTATGSNFLSTGSLAATSSLSIATTASVGTTLSVGTAITDAGTLAVAGAGAFSSTLQAAGTSTQSGVTLNGTSSISAFITLNTVGSGAGTVTLSENNYTLHINAAGGIIMGSITSTQSAYLSGGASMSAAQVGGGASTTVSNIFFGTVTMSSGAGTVTDPRITSTSTMVLAQPNGGAIANVTPLVPTFSTGSVSFTAGSMDSFSYSLMFIVGPGVP